MEIAGSRRNDVGQAAFYPVLAFFAPSVVTDMFFMPSDLIPLCLPETLLTHFSLAYKLGACQGDDEGPVLR
jgi:hypothetical protein